MDYTSKSNGLFSPAFLSLNAFYYSTSLSNTERGTPFGSLTPLGAFYYYLKPKDKISSADTSHNSFIRGSVHA